MRTRLVTLLILLMVAFPVWSASTVCCHVQKMQKATVHHCCEHMQMGKQHCGHVSASLSDHAVDHAGNADTCHCDHFQHSQFVLSLAEMLVAPPANRFLPPALSFQPLPERADVLYRPPIA